ncbi:MAG TPA: hypothetical protein VHA52_02355 [Candidatus Babeliaceae bacterium]|nr:hypothetical protein [Candidatus Babeliaceae bacterium]
MKIFGKLHYANCDEEIKRLKDQLEQATLQNINYMREMNDLTCQLRKAVIESKKECNNKCEKIVEIEKNDMVS